MEEIVVNKKELKGIRDSINKLLKSGGERITGHPEIASHESDELSGRHKVYRKKSGHYQRRCNKKEPGHGFENDHCET